MKKLALIKKPELFQGEKYLKTNKNYFEGWYFKNSNNKNCISFIPGVSINKKDKKAFVQIITNSDSYYIDYDIDEFSFSYDPFYIKIGNNYFSKNNIHIDINDKKQNVVVFGDIKYSCDVCVDTNLLNPNIMGVFSYVSFMECNHAIISMSSKVNGLVKINNKKIKFNNGVGYIEKDWGCSFPKSYIWCQGNEFKNSNASFMLSVAIVPFKLFRFRGIISSLIIDNKEYRFATYNSTKLIKYDIDNNSLDIVLKKGKYVLHIKSKSIKGHKLVAPIKGKMKKDILESISAIIDVTLKENNKVIFKDTSINCGLEIVND